MPFKRYIKFNLALEVSVIRVEFLSLIEKAQLKYVYNYSEDVVSKVESKIRC